MIGDAPDLRTRLFLIGLLAFVFGWLAFRQPGDGGLLSIITQALTSALMLAFFRNDMGLGATRGVRAGGGQGRQQPVSGSADEGEAYAAHGLDPRLGTQRRQLAPEIADIDVDAVGGDVAAGAPAGVD